MPSTKFHFRKPVSIEWSFPVWFFLISHKILLCNMETFIFLFMWWHTVRKHTFFPRGHQPCIFFSCKWSKHSSSYTSHASECWTLLPFFNVFFFWHLFFSRGVTCLVGHMAMHACQIGPTDTGPLCPGSLHRACVRIRGISRGVHTTVFIKPAVTRNLSDIQMSAGACWKENELKISTFCQNFDRWRYKSVWRGWVPVLRQPMYTSTYYYHLWFFFFFYIEGIIEKKIYFKYFFFE